MQEANSLLRIRVIGSPTLYLGLQSLLSVLPNKAQALLYYIVTNQRIHYRDELAYLFWPDMPDSQARKNLRNILPMLRTQMSSYISISKNTVMFNHDSDYWLDIEACHNLVGEDPTHVCTESLREVAELGKAEFLTGFYVRNAPLFEEWVLMMRQSWRSMIVDVLHTLASRHMQCGEYHEVLKATQQLLEQQPWREDIHRQQMQALAAIGQRSTALMQYEICRRILRDEFDIEPNEETTALYHQIRTSYQSELAPSSADLRTSQLPSLSIVPNSQPPATLSPCGQYIACATLAHRIDIRQVVSATLLCRLVGHTETVSVLAFSPDSRLLASASADQTVCLWNPMDYRLIHRLCGHTAAVTALTFSRDGTLLASASLDQTVRLWRVDDGSLVVVLYAHQAPVVYVATTPDGAKLVSMSSDQRIHVWELHPYRTLTNREASWPPALSQFA